MSVLNTKPYFDRSFSYFLYAFFIFAGENGKSG